MFSKALLAKTLTVKIAVAVCGVSVVGVSAAAATNSLPSGIQSKAHSLGFPAPKPATIHNDILSGAHHDSDLPHPGTPTPTGTSAKPAAAHDDQAALDAAARSSSATTASACARPPRTATATTRAAT